MNKKIQSLQHPLVKHLVKVRQNSDYRLDHQSVLIEGAKIIKELGKKAHFKVLMVTDETWIPKGIKAAEIVVVPETILEKVSGVKSPEGIIAEIAMPEPSNLKGLKKILALDGVNDPGNLGTLLRTALALGWEGVFILEESCDPFNEKALRAARGATFHLPLARGSWHDLKKIVSANKLQPYVADIGGENCQKMDVPVAPLLVLGNEARGTSEAAAQFCKKVSIPMAGKMESLNVAIAGSILMYAWSGGSR